MCVVEGLEVIDSALESRAEFEGLYLSADSADLEWVRDLTVRAGARGVRVMTLAPGVLDKISDTQSPQPVIASVRFEPVLLRTVSPTGLVVVLSNVRDPGNAGSVVRAAHAAGATSVVFCGDCVDPYNPKTIRATAGSIFHISVVVTESLESVAQWFHQNSGRLVATVARDGSDVYAYDLTGDVAIVLGNESQGLSDPDVALCDGAVTIPMNSSIESLNVAVASGVVLFESRRQRRNSETTDLGPNIEAT